MEYDWVRIFALVVVVVFHSMLPFTDQRWVINYSVTNPIPSESMTWTAWRTALFFFISGIVGGLGANSNHDIRSVIKRLKRILTPLAFGIAIIVPPQIYIELIQKVNYQNNFFVFLIFDCFRPRDICADDVCVSLLAWKHLWYLGYLAFFTLLVLTIFAMPICRAQEYVISGRHAWRFATLLGIGLCAALAIRTLVWLKYQPQDFRFSPISSIAAVSLIFFLLGRIFAKAEVGWQAVSRKSVALTSLCVLAYISLKASEAKFGISPYNYIGFGIFQFFSVIAIVGLFKKYLNKDSELRRYSSQYVIVYFLWHQTVIVIMDFFWNKISAPAALAFVATLASIIIFGWIVSRLCERFPLVAYVHGVIQKNDCGRGHLADSKVKCPSPPRS